MGTVRVQIRFTRERPPSALFNKADPGLLSSRPARPAAFGIHPRPRSIAPRHADDSVSGVFADGNACLSWDGEGQQEGGGDRGQKIMALLLIQTRQFRDAWLG